MAVGLAIAGILGLIGTAFSSRANRRARERAIQERRRARRIAEQRRQEALAEQKRARSELQKQQARAKVLARETELKKLEIEERNLIESARQLETPFGTQTLERNEEGVITKETIVPTDDMKEMLKSAYDLDKMKRSTQKKLLERIDNMKFTMKPGDSIEKLDKMVQTSLDDLDALASSPGEVRENILNSDIYKSNVADLEEARDDALRGLRSDRERLGLPIGDESHQAAEEQIREWFVGEKLKVGQSLFEVEQRSTLEFRNQLTRELATTQGAALATKINALDQQLKQGQVLTDQLRAVNQVDPQRALLTAQQVLPKFRQIRPQGQVAGDRLNTQLGIQAQAGTDVSLQTQRVAGIESTQIAQQAGIAQQAEETARQTQQANSQAIAKVIGDLTSIVSKYIPTVTINKDQKDEGQEQQEQMATGQSRATDPGEQFSPTTSFADQSRATLPTSPIQNLNPYSPTLGQGPEGLGIQAQPPQPTGVLHGGVLGIGGTADLVPKKKKSTGRASIGGEVE